MSFDDAINFQLRRDEGVRRSAYQDQLGYWTIGVGRLIDARKNGGLSEPEITLLLRNDLAIKQAELDRDLTWWRTLDEPRQGVLLNMAFQMGTRGLLGFVNTLIYVKARDYERAATAMLDSLWARQTPQRAVRLANQMRTGEWQ